MTSGSAGTLSGMRSGPASDLDGHGPSQALHDRQLHQGAVQSVVSVELANRDDHSLPDHLPPLQNAGIPRALGRLGLLVPDGMELGQTQRAGVGNVQSDEEVHVGSFVGEPMVGSLCHSAVSAA